MATHESDVLDEVAERRLANQDLRTVNALTDPTVLEPVIAGVTAGSKVLQVQEQLDAEEVRLAQVSQDQ